MRSIQGSLSLMSVPDVMQWADNNKRTGTLTVKIQGSAKKFYFQDGRIILVSSDKDGERLSEFLVKSGNISVDKMKESLKSAEALGIPFIGYLLTEKMIGMEELENILETISQRALQDVLTWDSGSFEFVDAVPATILNGPVKINTSFLLMESARIFDEAGEGENFEDAGILAELTRRIRTGNVELPPLPDIMQKLSQQLQRDDIPIEDIVNTLTDQILASKILKVSNSPFYGHKGKINSLQEAFVYMGLKSILSIVTVHALSGFSPKNAVEIRKILHHSLMCAFIAKRISADLRRELNEQAFTSGLVHDIGKTIMLNLTSDYLFSREARHKLIALHHQEVGYLLAESWNFTEEIKEVIRYHHHPEQAGEYRKLVEVVHLADMLANRLIKPEMIEDISATVGVPQLYVEQIMDELDELDKTVSGIIG